MFKGSPSDVAYMRVAKETGLYELTENPAVEVVDMKSPSRVKVSSDAL